MGSTPSKLSASRAAAVLGLSPWRTPVDVWVQIMSEEKPEVLSRMEIATPEFEQNAPMRWGLAFEDSLARLAMIKEDGSLYDFEAELVHERLTFLSCHLDGRFSPVRNYEAKTTNARSFRDKWGHPGTDRIPENYQAQVQLQMAISGAQETVVSVLVFPEMVDEYEKRGINVVHVEPEDGRENYSRIQLPGGELINPWKWAKVLGDMGLHYHYYVARNEPLIRVMEDKLSGWWDLYVQGETPPPAEKYSDVKTLITAPAGTVVANADIEELCAQDKAIAAEMRNAQKNRDVLKAQIGQYMFDNMDGAPIEDESRERILMYSRDGKKIRSYSKKGGLR